MGFGYVEKEGEIRTAHETCITARTTVFRVNVKPWSISTKGELISRLYDKERMLTHAAALQLISKKTAIPVPKLIGSDENPDGTAWLEIEHTHGDIWLDLVGEECRMPPGKKHTDRECEECARIAEANASRYIQDEILPQLNSLRSDTTGLNGVVIPPLWIMDYDEKTYWPPKKVAVEAGEQEYVFCHGNLHAHSILMHAETLHVMKVVDWDNAGFFPAEFQRWTVRRPDYDELFTNTDRCKQLTDLMV